MNVAEAAISSVNEKGVSFLLGGRVHDVDLALWRGSAVPKMGDIVEVALDGNDEVIRFFPRDAASPAPAPAQASAPSVSREQQEQHLALKRPAYAEKEVKIFGEPYVVRMRHGFVVSADTRTEQSISTSYRRAGTGWVPDIQSHEHTTSDIRLLQQGGKKADFTLGQKYKIHTGDEVTLFSLTRKGVEQGWWMGIQNHTTERWQSEGSMWTFEVDSDLNRSLKLFSSGLYSLIFFGYLVVAVLLALVLSQGESRPGVTWLTLLGIGGVVGFIHWLVAANLGLKKARERVREEVRKILSDFS